MIRKTITAIAAGALLFTGLAAAPASAVPGRTIWVVDDTTFKLMVTDNPVTANGCPTDLSGSVKATYAGATGLRTAINNAIADDTIVMYSTDNEALAMAQWRVSNFSAPTMRPTGLTFKPYRDLTGMFHRVLGRELGDRISVTKVLAGTDVEVDAVIEGISHQFSPGNDWQTSWNLSPIITGQFGPGGGGGATYLKLDRKSVV